MNSQRALNAFPDRGLPSSRRKSSCTASRGSGPTSRTMNWRQKAEPEPRATASMVLLVEPEMERTTASIRSYSVRSLRTAPSPKAFPACRSSRTEGNSSRNRAQRTPVSAAKFSGKRKARERSSPGSPLAPSRERTRSTSSSSRSFTEIRTSRRRSRRSPSGAARRFFAFTLRGSAPHS